MSALDKILQQMHAQPAGVRFADLRLVCNAYFGNPRASATSHVIYKTPWPGDPRVNIQSAKGRAKPYQVRQVLLAIEQLAKTGKGQK